MGGPEAPVWGQWPLLSPQWIIATVAIAVVYFLSGKLGLSLAYINASVSPIWPPTGIAIGAFLLFGRRVWPAIFVGAVLYNFTTAGTVATSLAIGTGNTLEGFVGAWLIQRFAGGRQAFATPKGVLRFALAAMLAATLSATIGVTTLALAGFVSWEEAGAIWLTWWAGDALGAIVMTPLIVLWAHKPHLHVSLAHWGEVLFLTFVGVITVWLVFDGRVRTALPIVLVLLWPALRFGPKETAAFAGAVSVVSVIATVAGRGPFQQENLNATLLILQTFLAIATSLALVVAGVVSERRKAEETTRRSQLQRVAAELEEARRMNDFKTNFINIASHELKTPLLPIKAQLFVLRESGQSMDAGEYAQSIGVLERNFERIGLLVGDLLDSGRLQADRIQLHVAPTDLAKLAGEAGQSFHEAAKAAGITVRLAVLGPVVVEADADRISQVIYNLLSNAVKCTPSGGSVNIEVARAPAEGIVTIQDTGVGLEPDQLAKLFAPFTQVHAGDSPEAKGTGLGLYISQGLIQRHGGRIWFASKGRGQGATVSFALPFRQGPMPDPVAS